MENFFFFWSSKKLKFTSQRVDMVPHIYWGFVTNIKNVLP